MHLKPLADPVDGFSEESQEVADKSGLLTMGQLAREFSVTFRALRFYQTKGLLTPLLKGTTRLFTPQDRQRLALIVQGKRLGFTLTEIRDLLRNSDQKNALVLPLSRKKCIEQIALLEKQRREVDAAIAELRQIYTEMLVKNAPEGSPPEPRQPKPS